MAEKTQVPAILVIGDDCPDVRVNAATLRDKGYGVRMARDGVTARRLLREHPPDLVLIQAGMTGADPFSLGRDLVEDPSSRGVPVVFTARGRDPEVIDRAYGAGAADVILLPCHHNEFLTRVAMPIRHRRLMREAEDMRQRDMDANPLTHLPGNNTIVAVIQEALDQGRDVAVIYSDLDNFKAYNDVYGFSAGDEALLFNAETLQTAMRQICGEEGFLGHVGGDDFVAMIPSGAVEEFGAKVTALFDAGVPQLYDQIDRDRGYIMAEDRQGNHRRIPLLSVSLGGVRLLDHEFTRFVEVAAVCAEVKHAAKSLAGSNLVMDRRSNGKRGPLPAPSLADLKLRI